MALQHISVFPFFSFLPLLHQQQLRSQPTSYHPKSKYINFQACFLGQQVLTLLCPKSSTANCWECWQSCSWQISATGKSMPQTFNKSNLQWVTFLSIQTFKSFKKGRKPGLSLEIKIPPAILDLILHTWSNVVTTLPRKFLQSWSDDTAPRSKDIQQKTGSQAMWPTAYPKTIMFMPQIWRQRKEQMLPTNSDIDRPALLFCHSTNIWHRVRQVWCERSIDMWFQL